MILGNINQNFDSIHLPRDLVNIIKFLVKQNFSKLENKKHPIKGDEKFMVITEYETKPFENTKAECHRKYIDFQLILSGQELFGVGFEDKANQLFKDYNPEKESFFYNFVKNEKTILLSQGDYIILFPGEIHRPGVCVGVASEKVRKAIVKILYK